MFKKDYIIGLDMGSTSIKVAQFATKDGGLYLVKTDLKEIKSTTDKASREKETIVALKAALHGMDLKKSRVVAGINCPMTSVKKIAVPYMPKAELEQALKLEAKNYFPFSTDKAFLDFKIINDFVESGVRKYNITIAASPRETVSYYLGILKKVGIKPASFIPCTYALQEFAERLPLEKHKVHCILDIGNYFTELIIFKDKELIFSRKIPVAGGDFTKAMTGVLVSDRGRTALSLEEAEDIKRKIGIPAEGTSKVIDDKISEPQILSMLRSPIEQLVNEIDRCLDYYRQEKGGDTINSLILFGGGAALSGLTGFLSEELGMDVRLGDALEGFKIEPGAINHRKDTISYRMELAMGAALNEGRGVNLLPPEIKEETKRVMRRGTIEAVVTAIVIISILSYIGMKMQLTNFRKRHSVATNELASIQPEFKKAEAYHLANLVLVNEPYWEDIFKELSNLVPENIYLTAFDMQNNLITMEGITLSKDGEQLISDFILTLERGIFKNVKLVRSRDLSEATGNMFELTCRVD